MKIRILLLSALMGVLSLQDVQAQFGGVVKMGGRNRNAQNRGGPGGARGGAGTPAWAQGANEQVRDTIGQIESTLKVKRYKAISGTRIYDAVTGELLDDARMVVIGEDEKANYYDDGRTGNDQVAGDEVFTNVEISDNVFISPVMQRVKESLIQALYEADRLDPVMFRGESIMALDDRQKSDRSVRWRMQRASKGVGRVLVQVPTERPVDVPNYYVEEENKDKKIGGESGWAKVFLDQYRLEAGNLQSEFYKVHIPLPPPRPSMEPPASDWSAFSGLEQDGLASAADFEEGVETNAGGYARPGSAIARGQINRGAGRGKGGGYFTLQ